MNLHLIQDTVFLNDFADLLTEMGEISRNHFYVYYTESKNKDQFKHLIKDKFKGTRILDCSLEELPVEASKYKNVFIHLLADRLFDFVRKVDPKVNLIWCTWGSDFAGPDELFAHETLDPLTLKYYKNTIREKITSQIEVNKVPFSIKFLYDYAREKYWHRLRVKAAISHHDASWKAYLEEKKNLLPRFNYLVNYGKDDYDFIKRYYNVSYTYIPFFYTVFSEDDNAFAKSGYLKQLGVQEGAKTIFIGNCGTIQNNHLDLIGTLKKIAAYHKDAVFIVPLSYGDKEYISYISERYKSELGDRFFPIYDFLEKEEYYKILNTIDVMFMNHNRNQGGTNLFKAIYFGKKVFVKNKNPLAKHLREHGVQLLNIEADLDKNLKDLFIPQDEALIHANKQAINSVFSKQMAIEGFRNILNTIK